jgi:hypothetical protein
MRKKTCSIIVPHGATQAKHSEQLCLPLDTLQKSSTTEIQSNSPCTKPKKAQISSISGISPRERNRYRVLLGDRILGDRLTIDEALKLAKRGRQ